MDDERRLTGRSNEETTTTVDLPACMFIAQKVEVLVFERARKSKTSRTFVSLALISSLHVLSLPCSEKRNAGPTRGYAATAGVFRTGIFFYNDARQNMLVIKYGREQRRREQQEWYVRQESHLLFLFAK